MSSSKPGIQALLACVALVACHVPEANVHNLREVRDPDGGIKRVGAPMTRVEYVARNVVLARLTNDGEISTKQVEEIEDPDALALENLIQLADCDGENLWVRGLQVEMATWLAVDDDYKLARERAVIELGQLARALGVRAPEVLGEGAVAATPEDVVEPLAKIVAAVRAYVERGEAPGADFSPRCAELDALVLDRDGARRVVAATNALLARVDHSDPALRELLSVHEHAAQRAVALALGAALQDKDALVRAAAIEALLSASDDELVGLRLRALEDPAEEVVTAVLKGIARRGLGGPAHLAEAEAESLRRTLLGRLVDLTRDLRSSVSAGACAALNRRAGSGFKSFRWEEWNRWWERETSAGGAVGSGEAGGAGS
jgi:hypothetical protein